MGDEAAGGAAATDDRDDLDVSEVPAGPITAENPVPRNVSAVSLVATRHNCGVDDGGADGPSLPSSLGGIDVLSDSKQYFLSN